MNREPIGLYIFRFVLGFGLFAFMCMLYWSSVLIEENVGDVKQALTDLKNDIFLLRTEVDELSDKISTFSINTLTKSSPPKKTNNSRPHERPHINPNLPNLLSTDPFYAVTLPNMLPKNFKPTGSFQNATIGKPDDLHPFSNWSQINTFNSMCNLSLARMKAGRYETFAPYMAVKIELRQGKNPEFPEFWVHLRDDVYWQPLKKDMFPEGFPLAPKFFRKHQVTAHDFKFFFDAVMNPFVQKPGAVALRNYIGNIKEIEVIDDLTLVVRWNTQEFIDEQGNPVYKLPYIAKQWTGALTPLAQFVYKYFSDGTKIIQNDADPNTYRTNAVWAQNFANHWAENVIVSCGAWTFEEMTERKISFKRNPEHFFPLDALAIGSVYQFKNAPDNVWQEFKRKNLDSYSLSPDQQIEFDDFLKTETYRDQANQGSAIKKLEYFDRSYTYIGWNMAKIYFKSQKLRRAMTLAIDRERIIKHVLDGMGKQLTGPFSPFSSAYDSSIEPWPFDPIKARLLLEEEGWYDRDGDGIVDKIIDGKTIPFEFRLTFYVKNPTTKAICEYVSTALEEIGVRCILKGVDIADLSAIFDDKGFDALCLAWGLGTPPEDPRQLWHSEGAKEPGSSNAVGFANKEADLIIDKLAYEDDPSKRESLYHRFHKIIHEEQPYTFLFTPKRIFLYREYLQNVFIPAKRQDLIPEADVREPIPSIFWLKTKSG